MIFVTNLERSPRIEVLRVDDDTEHDAMRWLGRRDERDYSFVDATSFAWMRKRRITSALAFDGDFAAAGFVELRPYRQRPASASLFGVAGSQSTAWPSAAPLRTFSVSSAHFIRVAEIVMPSRSRTY